MAIKIDVEKKLRIRSEWFFLLSMMRALGFDEKWIQWIRLNGSSNGFFKLTGGSKTGRSTVSFLIHLGHRALLRSLIRAENQN